MPNIDMIIQRTVIIITEVVKPVKIFLFGSAVNNTFHSDSDLDFLVVAPNGINKRKTSQEIYRKLVNVGFASDIIVVTQDDVKTYSDDSNYIIKTAMTEGKLVYG
ncbi:MAG: nucleotidyltransferase domain-containing protein [Bacteroidota bacterium]